MDESERQRRRNAVMAIHRLSTAFSKNMSDEMIEIYMDALSDIEEHDLMRAVNSVISNERYFPAVATIRAAAFEQVGDIGPEEAWGLVCERIRSAGRTSNSYGLPETARKAIKTCGGWMQLCESTNPTGDKITFTKAYIAFSSRNKKALTERWADDSASHKEIAEMARQIGRGQI